jgi:hypothetical protein
LLIKKPRQFRSTQIFNQQSTISNRQCLSSLLFQYVRPVVAPGHAGFTLRVNGTGFVSGAVVD